MKTPCFNIRQCYGLLRKFAVISLLVFSGIAYSYAQEEETDIFELNFEDNLTTPVLPAKSVESIKDNVERLKSALNRSGFDVKLVRNGEVILLTIPCAELFSANETIISPTGRSIFNKLALPTECRGKYKVLIAVHSDDTGEQMYVDDLTAARSNAIDDLLAPILNALEIISVPYGLGRDEPVKPNDSVFNRAANRRAEIYIVPLL